MPESPRNIALDLARQLQAAGFAAYWVGGCVRDLKLGREPKDYDIATNARPEQIEALFPRTLPVGRQFGVVIVMVEDQQFQIATFRAESGYADGRHPDRVEFGNPQADAQRRDFTINGLFYDPVKELVHDWVGGEADLRRRVIRAIGDPHERFAEDHLRLLRAVRFAAQLDFEIEAQTFAAVQANAAKIARVSAERVREELLKLFAPPHAARGLDLLRDSGLLKEILPEISAMIGCAQSPEHHPEGDVYEHARRMLSLLPNDAPPTLVWSALMHDIAKPVTATKDEAGIHFYGHEREGVPMTEGIMGRLKFPRREIETVCLCVRQHMKFMHAQEMRKATVRRMLMRPTFPLELELHRLDSLGSNGALENYDFLRAQAAEFAQQPALVPPLLNGNDLIALGIRPGPEMGRLLAEIRELQLQDELKTAEEARAWAQKAAAQLGNERR
jgi:poly(A) polymerase